MPFGAMPGADPATLARLKRWVRGALELPESTTVLVTELQCQDASCPAIETVIAVLEPGRTRKHTFAKPAAEVSWAEVIHLGNCWCPLSPESSAEPTGDPR